MRRLRTFLWRHRHEILLGWFFTLTVVLWGAALRLPEPGILAVSFFDVGQGDAIFIEAPNGNQILVDGGPNAAVLEKLGREFGFFDRSLDLVVLTHPDRDHLAGLLDVLDRYRVGAVLATAVKRTTADFGIWERKLSEKNVPLMIARAGMWAEVSPGMGFVVVSPDERLAATAGEKTNNTSIVLKLVYGDTAYLLTGDIERPVEELLVRKGFNLDADVLKAAHHGSKTSSSENFLRAVAPAVAIISMGRRNSYGHPHGEVVKRLERRGIKIFRTDLAGDVEMVSDGDTVWPRQGSAWYAQK